MALCTHLKSFGLTLVFSFFVAIGSFSGTLLLANSSEALTQNYFKNEKILSGWRTLASAVENCNGTFITRTEGSPDGQFITRKIDFKQKGDNIRSDVWIIEDKSKSLKRYKSFCTNKSYFFVLLWDQETGSTAKATEVNKQVPDLSLNPFIRNDSNGGALSVTRSSHSIHGVPLWELIEDKNFVLSNIKYVDSNQKVICADFSWKLPPHFIPPKSGLEEIVEGHVEFNMHEYGRIEKFYAKATGRVNDQKLIVYTDTYPEYSKTENGIPYVTKLIRYRSKTGHGKKELPKTIIEISDLDFSPAPNQDFTLSSYGLPEPDFGERRTNRFRYFLMSTGGLLIGIALWQMYQKRKEPEV